MKIASFVLALLSVWVVDAAAQTPPPTGLLVKDGQKVVFMGDSITGVGWSSAGGYIKLVVQGLDALGVKITPVPAGVGGNRSVEMLARVDKDALSLKPDWMLLNCGVNDVWSRSIDLDTFKKNITSIVDQAQAAGIKVMILTPTPIYEASTNEFNDKLPGYVAFMVQLAKDRNLPLADLNAAYFAYFNSHPPDPTNNTLTVDGVHPNPDGHQVIATTILEAFGVTPDQMPAVTKAWLDAPENASVLCDFGFRLDNLYMSLNDYNALKKVAADRNVPLHRLIYTTFMETVRDLLVAQGDLSKTWSDDISSKAVPVLKQRLEDLIKADAAAPAATVPTPAAAPTSP